MSKKNYEPILYKAHSFSRSVLTRKSLVLTSLSFTNWYRKKKKKIVKKNIYSQSTLQPVLKLDKHNFSCMDTFSFFRFSMNRLKTYKNAVLLENNK